jgi:glycine cleavage system aminomethyltransferase T
MDITKEYSVVRDGVGMFDLSGTAKFFVTGDDAEAFLEETATCSIEMIEDGMGANTLFLREDGTIVAICSIFRDEDRFIIFTVDEKRNELGQWLDAHNDDGDVLIQDKSDELGLLSILGYKAQPLTIEIAGDDIIAIPYMGFDENPETRSKIFRVGGTGEIEYRFLVDKSQVDALGSEILEKGAPLGISLCSNQILDALMVEMKSVNQLKDIERDTNAVQAGLVWMIDFGKSSFIGRDAVVEQKENLDKRLLVLACEQGDKVPDNARVSIQDSPVGYVVNQCFSKRLNQDLLMAYVDETFGWVGVEFDIETENNGIRTATAVSSPTFVTRSVEGEAS